MYQRWVFRQCMLLKLSDLIDVVKKSYLFFNNVLLKMFFPVTLAGLRCDVTKS